MKKVFHYFLGAASLFCVHTVRSQSFADSLAQDEHDIIVSIAPYSREVRAAILNVAQYPQVLVKLERIQSRSSQSFQDLVAKYARQEQEKFYEASRFPDLINQLVSSGQKSPGDIKSLLKDYPQKTQDQIADIYNSYFDDIVQMNNLYQSSQNALQKVTANYPKNVQNDFQKIVSLPDVMSLLTDNINLTMSLGESYRYDPDGITYQLDSLSNTLQKQNAQELDTYKKDVQDNQQLQEEMKKAATDYSLANNQPDTYVTNNSYGNYPYPYWFSYPMWYSSPMWYPQPLYYQSGYYIGTGGEIVVVGLPSRGYSNWFFNLGYRNYPLMYNHYRTQYSFNRNHYHFNINSGFHNVSHSHFSNSHQGNGNSFNINNHNMGRQQNINFNQMPQQHMFNNHGYEHFNATSSHNAGWNNIGGGRGFGGGFSGGHNGGNRSGGRH